MQVYVHITTLDLLEFPFACIAPLVGTATYFPVSSLNLHNPETGAAVILQSTAARITQVGNLKAIADDFLSQ